jgi:hypothetical protein
LEKGLRALLVNSSNYFIHMSVLYQINSTLAISHLKHFETNTNVVVERVPLFARTSSSRLNLISKFKSGEPTKQ